jgi:toxin-antitoxin system PIN domain toxin
MILPDANLLLHAVNSDSADHAGALAWWHGLLKSGEEVGICQVVAFAFLRVSTHRRAFPLPLSVDAATGYLDNWLLFPSVRWLDSNREDLAAAARLLRLAGTGGNLVSDAQIAATALRFDATVHTVDTDFARFPGVRWHHPLRKGGSHGAGRTSRKGK